MNQTIVYKNWKDYILSLSPRNRQKICWIVIYSPTTLHNLEKSGSLPLHGMHCYSSHISFDDILEKIKKVVEKSRAQYTVCIGLGGGATIDRAKFVTKELSLDCCIAIPSILSTNVFATDKVAYISPQGIKSTIESILPDIIVFDESLVGLDDKFAVYGLTDVLSIMTALKDWEIADREGIENIQPVIYTGATRILFDAKHIIRQGIISKSEIFELLLRAGYITNEYGSGRPESGSEHILAKIVESKIKVPHAVAVAFSMLIVSQFHYCFEEVAGLIDELHVFEEIQKIPYGILRDSIKELLPRKDRYSVVDTIDYPIDNRKADKLLRNMFKYFRYRLNSVIFDLDGVLWDALDSISKVYSERLGKKVDLKSMMGKESHEIANELSITVEELRDIQGDEIKQLLKYPGYIYDGVIDTLIKLKQSGRDLFIVSNCQKGYIDAFIEYLGLHNIFTDWLCEDDATFDGDPKAENLQFMKSVYRLKYPVYIGDTHGDYKSATEANIDMIAATYGFGKVDAKTLTIDDISELPEVLEDKYEYTTR